MLLYNSKILLVNYLEIQYLTHITFQEDLKIMTLNEIKAELFLMFHKMTKKKGRHLLFDARRVEHLVDTEFIEWFDNTILPLIISEKADKIVWLYRPEIKIPDLKENVKEKITQKFFNDSELAMKWLLDNAERKKFKFEN